MPTARLVIPLLVLACVMLSGQLWAADAKGRQSGEITAVDVAKLTVGVTTKPQKGDAAMLTINVPAGTFISIDKQPSSLSDLKVGDQLTFVAKDGVASQLVITRKGKK